MLKTNEERLVEMLLQCKPGSPKSRNGFSVDKEGAPFHLPSIGGITLNLEVGVPAFGWVGDHLEPGVSCRWKEDKPFDDPNRALQTFSCAGNVAKILSGKAKGKTGVVLGHHGGSEHVIVDFERSVKERMTYDDDIAIQAVGMGLELLDYPTTRLMNLSPDLLRKMRIKEDKKAGKMRVPVTTLVPSECMGSGIGSLNTSKGDYDIMTGDPAYVEKYKFDKIRIGDFVALLDQDGRYGRGHRSGAVTIGLVVHSDCKNAGHGPGVTCLMTALDHVIEPVVDPDANIGALLKIGTFRRSAKRKR